jgi:serine/threonine-protein kinase
MKGTTVGEYQILDRLGAGGMGEVYRAVHLKLGKVVAIKVLNQRAHSQSYLQRFCNEARLQAQLQHPRIVALYDFLEYQGQPCIVMEYIDGQTLDERIRIAGVLPTEDALNIFQAIVEGIGYVHEKGIIHRDIKSNNIKITSAGEVKLLDFGIAKDDSSPNLTMTGDVIGTLQYLSPEQIKGGTADERSDVWALGIIFYEMVSGQTPFDATTLGRLCDKICKANYLSPSTFNPSLPKDVEAIIARCLKKNASARYQSAREILADIERVKADRERAKLANVLKEEEEREKPQEIAKLVTKPVADWLQENWKVCAVGVSALLLVLIFFLMLPRKREQQEIVSEPINAEQQQQQTRTLKTVRINAPEGKAEVYRNGQLVGQTPYEIRAALGEQVSLTLKREGYADKRVDFAVTENKKDYTITLDPLKRIE